MRLPMGIHSHHGHNSMKLVFLLRVISPFEELSRLAALLFALLSRRRFWFFAFVSWHSSIFPEIVDRLIPPIHAERRLWYGSIFLGMIASHARTSAAVYSSGLRSDPGSSLLRASMKSSLLNCFVFHIRSRGCLPVSVSVGRLQRHVLLHLGNLCHPVRVLRHIRDPVAVSSW